MSATAARALVVLAVLGLLVPVVRGLPRRWHGPVAQCRRGPLWAWCPAEVRTTPHQVDAGVRRCLVCKTTTPAMTTEEERAHG